MSLLFGSASANASVATATIDPATAAPGSSAVPAPKAKRRKITLDHSASAGSHQIRSGLQRALREVLWDAVHRAEAMGEIGDGSFGNVGREVVQAVLENRRHCKNRN
eukprot:TRINITY_DN104949_c0_g1_i1.p1 TRINITY_DN104949_c0_g1~~TRINITY_DN104949_c0_g1_i1.p1  ORF type:complete len:107 (+),score=20.61 TRINITY_DN104949_c0_g1_i1:44-364(+)